MGLSRRVFTREFKLGALRRVEQGASVAEVARALAIKPKLLYRWREELRWRAGNAFPGPGQSGAKLDRSAELERKIGQQALEIDFLKACLQRIDEQRMLQVSIGSPRSTGRSRSKAGARKS
jgi:transposase-like protein